MITIILVSLSLTFSIYGLLVSVLYFRATRHYSRSIEYLQAQDKFLTEVHRHLGQECTRTAEKWDVFHRLGLWQ